MYFIISRYAPLGLVPLWVQVFPPQNFEYCIQLDITDLNYIHCELL